MVTLALAVVAYLRAFFVPRHRLALEAAALRQHLVSGGEGGGHFDGVNHTNATQLTSTRCRNEIRKKCLASFRASLR